VNMVWWRCAGSLPLSWPNSTRGFSASLPQELLHLGGCVVIFVGDRLVFGMAALRMLSSLIEFSAALLILFKFRRVEEAVRVNALLGLVGPTIFLLVSGLGLLGLAGRVPLGKMVLILLGIFFVLVGTTR